MGYRSLAVGGERVSERVPVQEPDWTFSLTENERSRRGVRVRERRIEGEMNMR
jgi:hypothetical protein